MDLHVFVVMPFGVKGGIDFNRVYGAYIKPALEAEGFEVFRAGEGVRAGNIRTDMFRELLIADLMAADLSIDNPNDWHELGMRARGVVQIACQGDYIPFDVYTDRKLSNHIKDGAPDPEKLVEDKKSLGRMARGDWFALNSSWQQLLILKDFGFQPEQTAAALDIFKQALANLKKPEDRWEPGQVFLFSGHMIDAPGRPEPRFPPAGEVRAAQAIAGKLAEWEAGEQDLALCGGACGGDLLFAEACLARGLRLELRIPFAEPKFLKESVIFAGEGWRERYFRVKENPRTRVFIMPEELGPLPAQANPYERNNLWLLYTALAWGPEKVRFLCLWDGERGRRPGRHEAYV